MSQALEILLNRYNHEISNQPLGIQIQPKGPEKTSQVGGYILASVVSGFGLIAAMAGLRYIAYAIIGVGVAIAANVWNRSQSTNIRKALSILIGAEDVTISQGFRSERIPRAEVKDIIIRQRTSDGQKQAQLFFVDASGRQHESLTFFGMSSEGLLESANRIADHIWNYVKADEEEHREINLLDLPPVSGENEERPPWG